MKKVKRIGIKVGSALLTNGRGYINKPVIISICKQISDLVKKRHPVLLVTSGAVVSDPKKRRSNNLRSAVGQPRIMSYYLEYLSAYKIEVAQMLLTDDLLRKKDNIDKIVLSGIITFLKSRKRPDLAMTLENIFQERENRELTKIRQTLKNIKEAFQEGIVPIINANDVIDNEELKLLEKCADNDELFKLVCQLMRVEIAIIGFDEAGVIVDNDTLEVVRCGEIENILPHIRGGHKLGYGPDGMKTKINVLAELARNGIRAILAPGKEENFILRAVAGEENFGTVFIP